MPSRVLLTRAGNAPSNNIARSLRTGSRRTFIVGCHDDQFILKNSVADKNYLAPPSAHPKWLATLLRILELESIDVIIPTVDADVIALSLARKRLQSYLFLPRASLLETCQDKYRLISFIRANGLQAPGTCVVEH